MKFLMYTTNSIYRTGRQTGGIKRFIELTEYINVKHPMSGLYSRDDKNDIASHGINNFEQLKDGSKWLKVFPPEVRFLLSNLSFIRKIKNSRYDRIIFFDVPTAIGPVLCGLNKVVLMIRKDIIGYEKVQNRRKTKWLKIGYQWVCESLCLMRARLIVTQCNYDKNVLKERHPLLEKLIEKKTVVQINNVNPSWIVTKSEKAEANSRIREEAKIFKVCFIGGFGSPRKGQDLFLNAATEILRNHSDVQFVLIGGGGGIDEYKKKFENENVIFLGRQENPIDILKQCDLLVVPSYADSCPNTVMEALYNGVPVIGSRAGGIPEILLDEESLFDLKISSLTNMIVNLINNPKKLVLMADRQSIRKKELTFNWAERIAEIISKY